MLQEYYFWLLEMFLVTDSLPEDVVAEGLNNRLYIVLTDCFLVFFLRGKYNIWALISINPPMQLLWRTVCETVFGRKQRLSNLDVIIQKDCFLEKHIYGYSENRQILNSTNNLNIFFIVVCIPMVA